MMVDRSPRHFGWMLSGLAALILAGCGGGGGADATADSGQQGLSADNGAPVINGTPPGTAVQGQEYSFGPTASDPDNDPLSFSVTNRPSWANFNVQTGELSGTPGTGDVNEYTNIVVTVSDGTSITALPEFTISVVAFANGTATLSWQPPTENEDGSPLTDLAGYRIYHGQSPGQHPNIIDVAAPGISDFTVDNLPPATHYFVLTAYNKAGLESDLSEEASKTITQ